MSLARAATPAQVEAALIAGKAYLYSVQKNGTWELVDKPDPKETGQSPENGQFTGRTAIAVYALLASGESAQDPRIAGAVDFLRKNETNGTYALAFRIIAFSFLPKTAENKAVVAKDARKLMGGIQAKGDALGMFDYVVVDAKGRDDNYSHSRAQYGVLGLWTAERMGVEIPGKVWQTFEKQWIDRQASDGGWAYTKSGQDSTTFTPGMTAVGVATLFIAQDYTRGNMGIECRGNLPNPAVDKGLKWMRDNFSLVTPTKSGDRLFVYPGLYAVERIGVASGYKYFGDIDWFDRGATYLVDKQNKAGSWSGAAGDVVTNPFNNTCFAMLFLARGRAPVVMNKLDYSSETSKDAPWNQRPRDVANVSRWIGKETERDLNWQIVNLSANVRDLHDAPILYISGSKELALGASDKAKLKQYVEEGGMIVGNADCGSKAFANSFQKLGKELFPGNEFRELPADHVIYTRQQYPRAKWKIKPQILGLSNGAREMMLLVPSGDPAKVWQVEALGGREELWQLMGNIFLYATDRGDLRFKGVTHLVDASASAKTTSTIKLARVQYNGAWDPEPGGWRRLVNVMKNAGIELKVTPVDVTGGASLDGYDVAHLTGAASFALDEKSRGVITSFINGGGTLIVDSAGGNADFTTSFDKELAAMFPGAKSSVLAIDSAVYASGKTPLAGVTYRPFARRTIGAEKGPRVEAIEIKGRPAVFISREDLSVGLVGQTVDGIVGYSPATATDLMSRQLTFASPSKK